jgi:hypothetical protein
MQTSVFMHHFPTFGRLVIGLVSAANWILFRLQANARAITAIALVIAILLGWREFLVHTQRDAVAAIERGGGNVSYDWDWRNGQPLRSSSQPPWRKWLASKLGPDLFGHVVAVDFHGSKGPSADSVLKQVAALRRLEFLSLVSTGVTDEGLASLRDLTGLKTLRLQGTAVRGPGLAHLERMVELEELTLPNAPISDEQLAHLAGLTKLKRLRISGKFLTNAGLAHLGAMQQMENLTLRHTSITTLEPIRAMTQLKYLDVGGSPIDDAGLKPVAGFTELQLLWLGSTRVTDAGLMNLDRLPNLRILDLEGTRISDTGLGLLCNLPLLNRLNLYDTRVTGAGLADKLGNTTCRELVVSGPEVTSAQLDLLRMKFPGMRIRGADLTLPRAPPSMSK